MNGRTWGVRFVAGTAAPEGAAVIAGGERLEADRVVWAGGAWLAGLFPDLVDLRVTRQDVYFFGAPAGWQAPAAVLREFIDERLAGLLRDQGYAVQEIDAVLALRPARLGDVGPRLAAVRAFRPGR